jgi:predicted nucleic acid-binding protein
LIVVLDSSAAVEVVLARKKAGKFKLLIENAEQVVSSDLFKAEVANTLWKYVRAELLGGDKTNKLLHLAEELVDEFVDIANNNEESMHEAIRLNHSTYDMLYFTLARRFGATLISVDKKLNTLCAEAGIPIP